MGPETTIKNYNAFKFSHVIGNLVTFDHADIISSVTNSQGNSVLVVLDKFHYKGLLSIKTTS